MSNQNYQIAKFYTLLFEMRKTLNAEILPLGLHIGTQTEDAQLFESLEIAANDIERHLENYGLSVGKKKLE